MEPTSTFHDAQNTVQKSQLAELIRRSKPEGKDAFTWQDPLRDFESLGQHVPSELRYWTNLTKEIRLEWLGGRAADQYSRKLRPGEDPAGYWNRMKIAWRDLAYILGEELKCYLRPELVGRGSQEVIKLVLAIAVHEPERPALQAPKKK